MSDQSCLNCGLAEWQYTAKDRISKILAGKCLWEFPDILIPISVNHYYKPKTGGIWAENNKDCPQWKVKPPVKNNPK